MITVTHRARINGQSSPDVSMRGPAVLTDLPTLAAAVRGAFKRRFADWMDDWSARKRRRTRADHEASRSFSTPTHEKWAILQPSPPLLTPPHVPVTPSMQPTHKLDTDVELKLSAHGRSMLHDSSRLIEPSVGEHLAAMAPSRLHSDLGWQHSQPTASMLPLVGSIVSKRPCSEQGRLASQHLRCTWKDEDCGHEILARLSRSSLLGVAPLTSSGRGLSAIEVRNRLRGLINQGQHDSVAPSNKLAHHVGEQSQQASATRSQVDITRSACASLSQAQAGRGSASPLHRVLSVRPSVLRKPEAPRNRKRRVSWSLPPNPPSRERRVARS